MDNKENKYKQNKSIYNNREQENIGKNIYKFYELCGKEWKVP